MAFEQLMAEAAKKQEKKKEPTAADKDKKKEKEKEKDHPHHHHHHPHNPFATPPDESSASHHKDSTHMPPP
jgi:hypothetical protein